MRVEDIPPGEARALAVDGVEVAVFRTRGGQLHALDARCPHRGGPLADGLCDERVVVCPLHGRSFGLASGREEGGELEVTAWDVAVDADGTIRVHARAAATASAASLSASAGSSSASAGAR